jgi:hypothetical protein
VDLAGFAQLGASGPGRDLVAVYAVAAARGRRCAAGRAGGSRRRGGGRTRPPRRCGPRTRRRSRGGSARTPASSALYCARAPGDTLAGMVRPDEVDRRALEEGEVGPPLQERLARSACAPEGRRLLEALARSRSTRALAFVDYPGTTGSLCALRPPPTSSTPDRAPDRKRFDISMHRFARARAPSASSVLSTT